MREERIDQVLTESAKANLPIGLRLKHHLNNWMSITKNKEVLRLIQDGLKLAFQVPPVLRKRCAILKCPPEGRASLAEALRKYQQQKFIQKEYGPPRRSSLYQLFFSVPKPNQENALRWILDCRYLNGFVQKKKFKMEGLSVIREMLEKGDHMTSIDVKDAFHHLVVNGRFRKFLSFYALGQRYRWRTLPMGLTSSPLLWTTIMTEVMKKLRTEGIRLSFYMDDVIIMANTEDQSIKHTKEY